MFRQHLIFIKKKRSRRHEVFFCFSSIHFKVQYDILDIKPFDLLIPCLLFLNSSGTEYKKKISYFKNIMVHSVYTQSCNPIANIRIFKIPCYPITRRRIVPQFGVRPYAGTDIEGNRPVLFLSWFTVAYHLPCSHGPPHLTQIGF